MLIYILVIVFILLLMFYLSGLPAGKLRDKFENRALKAVCWLLVLLAALRGISVGADTLGYWQEYFAMSNRSFAEVLERAADYPGYFLLAKTCSYLQLPIQVMFGLVEGIYVYAIFKFISRYSEDKLFSILGFFCIGLYMFSLAGLKQTLSMSFVLLYYLALDDKKFVKAVLLAVVAYYCHPVSLIFLAGVALYYMRNLKLFYVYLAIVVVAVSLGTRFLWAGMLSLLDSDHYSTLYSENEGYSSTTMMIYGANLLALYFFGRNYRQQRREESRIMLGMSTFAVVFQLFSFVSSAAFRLSFFFLPYMIVAFSNDFNRIGITHTRRLVKAGMITWIIFVFVYAGRNSTYVFFWQ